jgi:hypothetical protein
MAYLLLYVDDMILSASSPALLQEIIAKLRSTFAVKDMGALHYFLGLEVQRFKDGFFLSQHKYTADVLERAGMANCKPLSTSVDTKQKLSNTDGDLLPDRDASWYRAMAGALQYLTLTPADIAYSVQQAHARATGQAFSASQAQQAHAHATGQAFSASQAHLVLSLGHDGARASAAPSFSTDTDRLQRRELGRLPRH